MQTASTKALVTLVIEIGGTLTRMARVEGSELGTVARFPTPNYLTHGAGAPALLNALLERIRETACEMLEAATPDVAVIAYPGPVTAAGVALRSPTIFGTDCTSSCDVRAGFAAVWPTARLIVINDVTGSGYYFVERGHRDFCVVTVGSGIGNKVFLNGRPVVGSRGFGGELGHLKLAPHPRSAVADTDRELGELASGRGTVWLAQDWVGRRPQELASSMLAASVASLWSETDGADAIAQAFRSKDPLAHRIVEAGAYPLAQALSAIHLGLGVERFFIVGGFAKALGEDYRSMLARLAHETSWHVGQTWTDMIEIGPQGVDEALAGAAYLARTNSKPSSAAALRLLAS